MSNYTITDTDIFNGLRDHISPAKLSQLLVDITNKAMEDKEFRNTIIDELQVGVTTAKPYNLDASNLKKVYSNINMQAVPFILKYAESYGIKTKRQMCAFIATCIIEPNSFNKKDLSYRLPVCYIFSNKNKIYVKIKEYDNKYN